MWRRGILVAIVALIAIIQVLPQVDLPDTTAHEDDIPVIEKARLAVSPVLLLISVRSALAVAAETRLQSRKDHLAADHPASSLCLPILHSALLC